MAEETQGFLDDEDYYDDFGFNFEPDFIQRSTAWMPPFLRDYLSQGSAQQRKIKCGIISCVSIVTVLIFLIIVITGIILIVQLTGGDSSSDDNDYSAPKIAGSFQTNMVEQISLNGYLVADIGTFMWSDNKSKNSRIDWIYDEPHSDFTHDMSEYLNSMNMKMVDNGICRLYPEQFNDIFSFLDEATYQGDVVQGNQTLQVYYFTEKTNNGNATFVAALDGDIPVQLNITVNSPGTVLEEDLTFTNFEPVDIPESIFETPSACDGDGEVCEGSGVELLDFITYSPEISAPLDNTNGGDLLGAAGTLCDYMYQYSYVSLYQLQVNNSWGQYGVCYQGFCNGANSYTVGRAATSKVKDMEGQCADNSDVGNWYSLTSGARCSDYQEIGDDNCAWKELYLNTTITMDCLKEQGFENSCSLYPYLPYTNPSNALKEALYACENVSNQFSEDKVIRKSHNSDNLDTNRPKSYVLRKYIDEIIQY